MSQFHDLQMTGPELDDRLAQVLTNEQAIGDETEARQQADQTLQGNIDAKANASDVYTKTEADDTIDAAVLVEKERAEGVEASKANAADVYDKSQVYTKQQTDDAIAAEAQIRQAEDEKLQGQIIDIMDQTAELSLNASQDVVEVGYSTELTLTAVSSLVASLIQIKRGTVPLEPTGEGTSLTLTDTVTPNAEGPIAYKAFFTINGEATGPIEKVVHAVLPTYYGAGDAYTDADQSALKVTPAGEYDITVATTGQHMFIVVPYSQNVHRVTMNGFGVPMDAPTTPIINGYAYKAYKTSNAYDAGTYKLIVE